MLSHWLMKQKTEPVARMEVKDGITLEFLCVERKVVEVYPSTGCVWNTGKRMHYVQGACIYMCVRVCM